MKIDNSVENWMKEWVSIVNKTTPQEDFWIETPFGDIKNPKVISTENFKDNELTELKQLVEPEKIEKVDDVVVETDVLNSVIEDADKTDTEPPKVLVKPFYCELTDRYFTTKSSLAKHIKKSKEYQKALSLTTN